MVEFISRRANRLIAHRPDAGRAEAAHDPSTKHGYYVPLLSALRRQAAMPIGRLEIPITHNHWEAAYVAPTVVIARGWERQLDRQVNGIFYRGRLNATSYRAWLDRLGVRWVAVPDTRLEGAVAISRLLMVPPRDRR